MLAILAEMSCRTRNQSHIVGFHAVTMLSGFSPPGQAVPRQALGGQASTLLVKSPSEALAAVAPSSQGAAALQTH